MTDFRALCAELADSVELLLEMRPTKARSLTITEERLSRARAALAQPDPEELTADQLMDIACATDLVYDLGEDCGFASPYAEVDITQEVLAFARAVLARYGKSTSTPTNA